MGVLIENIIITSLYISRAASWIIVELYPQVEIFGVQIHDWDIVPKAIININQRCSSIDNTKK